MKDRTHLLAYDGPLIGVFLAVFLRTIQAWYRQQARAQGYTNVQCGSVTFVQRFDSALNLNPPKGGHPSRKEGDKTPIRLDPTP